MTAQPVEPVFSGEVHPFAARFPMLPDDELADLADDIRAHGQLHPIVLDPAGVLLDGRNRLAACELAGVEPWFTVHEGWPAALIVSANVRRRQMTPGQVAMAAAIGLAEQGQRINGRWKRGSLDIPIGRNISYDGLNRAGIILDYDEERGTAHADQVLTGAATLTDTYKIVAQARRAERDAVDAAGAAEQAAAEQLAQVQARYAALRDEAPDLAELVRLERLPLDEATAAWEQRKLEQALAHQEALNAWSEAVDGLTTALSYFAGGNTPPADLPTGHTPPAEFIAQLQQLNNYAEEIH